MAHTTRLSPSQQLAVLTANCTGVVHGRNVTLRSLADRGITDAAPFRLTQAGHALREQLQCPVEDVLVDYGNGDTTTLESHARVISDAWAKMRAHRVTHGSHAAAPSAWEQIHPMRAAAIILEACGARPSATDEYGRRVRAGYALSVPASTFSVRIQHHLPHEWTSVGHPERRESIEIHTVLTDAYDLYTRILEAAGWNVRSLRPGISGVQFLLASPRTT